MRKALAFPLTVIYYLAFFTTLLVFHAIQWVCHYAFGYHAHKRSVDILNATLIGFLGLIGTRIRFPIPTNSKTANPISLCVITKAYTISRP